MAGLSLKGALLVNAVFSAVCALLLLGLSEQVAGWLGNVSLLICQLVGGALVLFVVMLVWTATRSPLPVAIAKWITLADIGWVLATPPVMLLAATWLSGMGHFLLVAVAACVGVCAWLQGRHLEWRSKVA
jgi:hypothetical protein